jgi:hypothetical protein
MKTDKREIQIRVLVNDLENKIIEQRAKDAGWSKSGYLRWLGLCMGMPDMVKAPKKG